MEKNEPRLFRTSIYTGGTSPIKMIQAGFYHEDCIVYDVPHLRRAGQAIEFAVAGYTVEHGGVVPAGERHTRKIEQAAGCSESG